MMQLRKKTVHKFW